MKSAKALPSSRRRKILREEHPFPRQQEVG